MASHRAMHFERSLLLSDEENRAVVEIIQPRCEAFCTAVVELYICFPLKTVWDKRCNAGVMCVIKDYNKRSYYFRMYDMMKLRMVWEQEVYNEINLEKSLPFFIMFEGEEGFVGINFQSSVECDNMYNLIFSMRDRKRPLSRAGVPSLKMKNSGSGKKESKKGKGGKKKKITADMIGQPENFRVIEHYDSSCIKNMGPSSRPTPHPSNVRPPQHMPAPRNINRAVSPSRQPPPIPANVPRQRPPVPPPSYSAREYPQGPPIMNQKTISRPPPIVQNRPPPPSVNMPMPPPPPPTFEPAQQQTLKISPQPSLHQPAPMKLDPRDELMRAIQSGNTKLRSVEPKDDRAKPSGNPIQDALQMRINQIKVANQESSSDEDESDYDEWEED